LVLTFVVIAESSTYWPVLALVGVAVQPVLPRDIAPLTAATNK